MEPPAQVPILKPIPVVAKPQTPAPAPVSVPPADQIPPPAFENPVQDQAVPLPPPPPPKPLFKLKSSLKSKSKLNPMQLSKPSELTTQKKIGIKSNDPK